MGSNPSSSQLMALNDQQQAKQGQSTSPEEDLKLYKILIAVAAVICCCSCCCWWMYSEDEEDDDTSSFQRQLLHGYIDCTCPLGSGPGSIVVATLPNGLPHQVVVPAGVYAGMTFSVAPNALLV